MGRPHPRQRIGTVRLCRLPRRPIVVLSGHRQAGPGGRGAGGGPLRCNRLKEQLAALKDGGAEGLFIAVYGGDAIAMYRQAKLTGLIQQMKVLTDSTNEFLVPFELGSIPQSTYGAE